MDVLLPACSLLCFFLVKHKINNEETNTVFIAEPQVIEMKGRMLKVKITVEFEYISSAFKDQSNFFTDSHSF